MRLRRQGRRTLQTLKVLKAPLAGDRAPGGLHRLEEWEMPLPAGRAAPDVAALLARLPAGSNAREAVRRAARQAGFGERIGTHFRRTSWRLASAQGDLVEVALDIGEIRAGGQVLPLCEVELELKGGREHALFALAQALHAGGLPLRIERRGKAERGLALLAGAAAAGPCPTRTARAVHLSPTCPWPVALRALVEECLAQVQGNEQGVVEGNDAEHVHQMRVGLRRLRAALGLFKDVAAAPQAVRDGLRASATCLGEARDAEVLVHETLARIPAPPHAAAGLAWAALLKAARAEADAARQAAAQAVRSAGHTGWQLGLMAWVSGLDDSGTAGGPDAPPALPALPALPKLARQRLRRLRRRLVKLGQRLGRQGDEADAAACHAVRLAAKKLRYATEMLGALEAGHRPAPGRGRRHAAGGTGRPSLAAGPTPAAVRALAALQQRLGLLNDGQVAAARLQALAQRDPSLAAAAGYALGWLAGDGRRRMQRLGKPWRRVQAALQAARR